jgi:putative zinc finger protein
VSCEEARADLSAFADGELPAGRDDPLTAHLAGCPACTAFQHRLASLRRRLRFEPVGAVPDVAPRVMATIRSAPPAAAARRRAGPGRQRPGRLLPVAAAFLCGALLGATFIGLGRGGPGQVAMADLPAQVVAAQRTLSSLAADVSLIERGWHPSIPERRFSGRLRYRAPEALALELADRTAYPSAAWVPADLSLVVTGDRWWTRGPRACPVEAQPACPPGTPLVRLVERREPFADATPVPLDLVTPVRSFTPAGAGTPLGRRRVAGRAAIGVATTAAQVAPLLAGLAGNLRALHPADRVELWLDEQAFVPLALRVTVASGGERQRWAAASGYRDQPGQAVLELVLSRVSLNRPLDPAAFPAPPADARPEDAGFRAGPVEPKPGSPGEAALLAPAWLPAGFRPYRAGLAGGPPGPRVAVRTWTDGRAWVKVRATRDWPGGRLFGDLGPLVRPAGAGAGIAYSNEDGSRIAVHGAGVDLAVTGSLRGADLARVAASLPVTGRPVPAGWAEAATSTLPEAGTAVPGLLRPPDPAGFAPPAVRVDGRAVTLAYAGPGTRGFLLVQAPGHRLAPPLDERASGVRVRGSDGRWSPGRGELEWVERGRTLALHSATLSVEELLAIATSLEPV